MNGTTTHCSRTLIKSTISYSFLKLKNYPSLDATAVKIKLPDNPPIAIFSVYARHYCITLYNDLKDIFANSNETILCCDYNTHHELELSTN